MLIDPFMPDWQDHLGHQQPDATKDLQLFLLIDGAFLPDFYRAVRKALPDNVKMLLLFESLPGCTDKTRAVSPFLVPYSTTSPALRRVLNQCSGWPMVSAIETTENLEQLAKRLSA